MKFKFIAMLAVLFASFVLATPLAVAQQEKKAPKSPLRISFAKQAGNEAGRAGAWHLREGGQGHAPPAGTISTTSRR